MKAVCLLGAIMLLHNNGYPIYSDGVFVGWGMFLFKITAIVMAWFMAWLALDD
jgi:hypothetical protein